MDCCCEICSVHLNIPGICGRCQTNPPMYGHSIIPFRYQPPVSDHIKALKYSDQLHYAVSMAKMLSLWVMKNPSALPDTIIPIPLHRQRIRQRGFNQSSEISRIAGRILGVPTGHAIIKRVKNTVTQVGLSEKMRAKNVKNAFAVKNPGNHRHVALLDDVVTSGSTVNAAAASLIAAGVKRVSVWAVARSSFTAK